MIRKIRRIPDLHRKRRKTMKVLFTAGEAYPFIMSGGLGEVAGALPKALSRLEGEDNDVRVIIPLYSKIAQSYRDEMIFMGSFTVKLAWRNQYCGLFYYQLGKVKFYFLDNEYYFKRDSQYGEFDDGERFAFFSKAVLDACTFLGFYPDIIHANDWHTALVPVYLSTYYKKLPGFADTKALFTIHNIQYQGRYDMGLLEDVFDLGPEHWQIVEYDGCINLMKGAITAADFVGTVSPSYAEEIMDPYYAHDLDPILRLNKDKVCGILNGIDVEDYDPETDPALSENFSADSAFGKTMCKGELQRTFGLSENPDIPVIAMVTRLVGHKGLDLLNYIIDDLGQRDMQLVVLGTGDSFYEKSMVSFSEKYPDKISAKIIFDKNLSRKIYAGADIFLMPSKSEPCGLAQMVALRYGTVPVVRQTGGLRDSIPDYGDGGTGFTFRTYNAHDMLGAIDRALGLYEEPKLWSELCVRAMRQDMSWNTSAVEYMKLYKKICGKAED